MIYKLPERINKEAFYNKILPDLTKQYMHIKKGENTAVSLVQTEQINSNVLPLFIGMLNLLQNKSSNPVYLELAYNPSFLAFLESTGFFYELTKHGIIEYDEDYVGGFSDYRYNRENKILPYTPVLYFENKSEEEKTEIRDRLAEEVRGDLLCTSMFKERTTPIKNDELFDTMLVSTTELIVNAIIYSNSMSYTYLQSGISFSKSRKGYILSVVDVGRGYYTSLGEKIKCEKGYKLSDRYIFYRNAEKLGIDIVKEINFLSIMEALYFSQMQYESKIRDMNFYGLKELLAISNANLRIHQRNKEVVFTAAKCSKCAKRDILHCVECIWSRRNMEKSPLKTYPVAMAGVHIEVEFIQERKNV